VDFTPDPEQQAVADVVTSVLDGTTATGTTARRPWLQEA
jgi:hypothetical protein